MGKCLGHRTMDGDYECEYSVDINCEDCIYGPYGKGVDPEEEERKHTDGHDDVNERVW